MPVYDLIYDPGDTDDLGFIKVEGRDAEEAVELARLHLATMPTISMIIVQRDGIHVRTVRRDKANPPA